MKVNKSIWLINPYGPIEGENWREYSFNQFGKYLSSNGYNVVWWTSSFSHHFKKQRSKGWKDIKVNERFVIRLVPTTTYKKNFGVGRLVKDITFSINSKKLMKKEKSPNLIICAENPLLFGEPAYKYSKKNNIPLVIDQMDIWPEFITKQLSNPWKAISRLLFIPIIKSRKKRYDSLNGSIALGRNYQNFMLDISPILNNRPKALIYNGIDVIKFREMLNNKVRFDLPIKKDDDIWCIFAGTLGPSYDVDIILKAAKKLENEKRFKFIIAGSGPMEKEIIALEKKQKNLIYLGKLLPKDLIPVYALCDIGLCTYSQGSNVDMPDKFYDYTAAGLAIINSLQKEVKSIITDKKLGINYIPSNLESLITSLLTLKNKDLLVSCKKNSHCCAMEFDMHLQNNKLRILVENILCVEKSTES